MDAQRRDGSSEPTDPVWHEAGQGDEGAFASLVERFREPLRLRVGRLLQDENGAETGDVVQTVFLRALRRREAFDWESGGEDAFLAWLYSIARNRVRDLRRKHRPGAVDTGLEAGLAAQETSLSERVDRGEREERLHQALAQLEPHEARVLRLRQMEGHSFEEIGEALERSPEAARKLHARALLKLGSLTRRLAEE